MDILTSASIKLQLICVFLPLSLILICVLAERRTKHLLILLQVDINGHYYAHKIEMVDLERP